MEYSSHSHLKVPSLGQLRVDSVPRCRHFHRSFKPVVGAVQRKVEGRLHAEERDLEDCGAWGCFHNLPDASKRPEPSFCDLGPAGLHPFGEWPTERWPGRTSAIPGNAKENDVEAVAKARMVPVQILTGPSKRVADRRTCRHFYLQRIFAERNVCHLGAARRPHFQRAVHAGARS